MDRRLFKFFWCFALPFCFASLGFRMGMVVSLACGVAFLLDLRTCAGQKIKDAYYALTDEAKEKAVFLERENRELLGKHDYEIQLATLAERNRIAREIHDNVGHLLTRSLLQIDALKIKIDSQGESPNISSNSDLDLVRQTLSEAMDSIRLSVHDMHDESINLKLQLEAIIKGFNFCPVKLCYDAGELPIGLRTAFAAIVREALSNIARHSKANQAMVTITEHPAFYQLIICDNGTAEVTRASGGIGLYNMADRVNALGGVFRIEDTAGFKIFISVPKEI
ncbi:MAG: histidine kinase [Lachnospiraceae bacterium]|nr:histidine kinase [Lachnospiraceae bacterium]